MWSSLITAVDRLGEQSSWGIDDRRKMSVGNSSVKKRGKCVAKLRFGSSEVKSLSIC